MPRVEYTKYKPNAESKALIDICNAILQQYSKQGYQLTLRQLYYQLVSKDIIPNSQKFYDKLGTIVASAREGGLIDWNHIEDRTRSIESMPHWSDGKDFLKSVAPQFNLDLWTGQEKRVVVFVEKEALAQIVEKACKPYDVSYMANKGYLSASAAWNVAHNVMLKHPECHDWIVLHLGDHDPSGIDMTRDIQERLQLFASRYRDNHEIQNIEVNRIALTMDQVQRYNPPPNPAKTVDPRFKEYEANYGDESWELDALQPQVITKLIHDNIETYLDTDKFEAQVELQNDIRAKLAEAAESF